MGNVIITEFINLDTVRIIPIYEITSRAMLTLDEKIFFRLDKEKSPLSADIIKKYINVAFPISIVLDINSVANTYIEKSFKSLCDNLDKEGIYQLCLNSIYVQNIYDYVLDARFSLFEFIDFLPSITTMLSCSHNLVVTKRLRNFETIITEEFDQTLRAKRDQEQISKVKTITQFTYNPDISKPIDFNKFISKESAVKYENMKTMNFIEQDDLPASYHHLEIEDLIDRLKTDDKVVYSNNQIINEVDPEQLTNIIVFDKTINKYVCAHHLLFCSEVGRLFIMKFLNTQNSFSGSQSFCKLCGQKTRVNYEDVSVDSIGGDVQSIYRHIFENVIRNNINHIVMQKKNGRVAEISASFLVECCTELFMLFKSKFTTNINVIIALKNKAHLAEFVQWVLKRIVSKDQSILIKHLFTTIYSEERIEEKLDKDLEKSVDQIVIGCIKNAYVAEKTKHVATQDVYTKMFANYYDHIKELGIRADFSKPREMFIPLLPPENTRLFKYVPFKRETPVESQCKMVKDLDVYIFPNNVYQGYTRIKPTKGKYELKGNNVSKGTGSSKGNNVSNSFYTFQELLDLAVPFEPRLPEHRENTPLVSKQIDELQDVLPDLSLSDIHRKITSLKFSAILVKYENRGFKFIDDLMRYHADGSILRLYENYILLSTYARAFLIESADYFDDLIKELQITKDTFKKMLELTNITESNIKKILFLMYDIFIMDIVRNETNKKKIIGKILFNVDYETTTVLALEEEEKQIKQYTDDGDFLLNEEPDDEGNEVYMEDEEDAIGGVEQEADIAANKNLDELIEMADELIV
jgi:hypothetical protein